MKNPLPVVFPYATRNLLKPKDRQLPVEVIEPRWSVTERTNYPPQSTVDPVVLAREMAREMAKEMVKQSQPQETSKQGIPSKIFHHILDRSAEKREQRRIDRRNSQHNEFTPTVHIHPQNLGWLAGPLTILATVGLILLLAIFLDHGGPYNHDNHSGYEQTRYNR